MLGVGLGERHVADFMNMLIAKRLRAVFVTADRRLCSWARRVLDLKRIYLLGWWKKFAKNWAEINREVREAREMIRRLVALAEKARREADNILLVRSSPAS